MKANALPIIAFLAALAAFVFLPVSAVAASIAVSVTGLVSVLAGDYGRSIEPLRTESPLIPFDASCCPPTRVRDAA
jgi:hypothetical protein